MIVDGGAGARGEGDWAIKNEPRDAIRKDGDSVGGVRNSGYTIIESRCGGQGARNTGSTNAQQWMDGIEGWGEEWRTGQDADRTPRVR